VNRRKRKQEQEKELKVQIPYNRKGKVRRFKKGNNPGEKRNTTQCFCQHDEDLKG